MAAADRGHAARFLSLALAAEKDGQEATARRLFDRILDLDADHATARKRLGFRRKGSEWSRDSAAAAEVDRRVDRDPSQVEGLRTRRVALEEARASDLTRLLERCGALEEREQVLLGLLAVAPRSEDVHRALGHQRVGEDWARPELLGMARSAPERLKAWAALRAPAEVRPTAERVAFSKGGKAWDVVTVGERRVASSFGRAETVALAGQTELPHRLVRHLLGEDVKPWDRSPVYFLDTDQYKALVYSRHADGETRRRKLRFSTYRSSDCCAFRARTNASDLYAHTVGFWTTEDLVSPPGAEGKPDDDTYSWFKEGFSLLLTLELLDSAASWFTSRIESTGKAQPTEPMPEARTAANCLAYVRNQLYDGALPPLREIRGNSLNNLDRFRSLVAWSFVRFLALYDPDAFRGLPAALKAQTTGPEVERADRALEAAYGRPAADLDRLWRAWLLELTPP
jgi:hypothetical protein